MVTSGKNHTTRIVSHGSMTTIRVQNSVLNTIESVSDTLAILKPSSCKTWGPLDRQKMRRALLQIEKYAQTYLDVLDGFKERKGGELVDKPRPEVVEL